MLAEALKNRVQVFEEAVGWEEAINLSARPLLEQGCITEGYIEAMKDMCREHNAYIVLADYFAMPHASPESGVREMGVALSIFRQAVDFMGKPVHVVLVLASADKGSHLKLLGEVAGVLGEPSNVERLSRARDADEVLELFRACAR